MMRSGLVVSILAFLQVSQSVPTPAPQDPFGPAGELGAALASQGDIPFGPAPKGCSKYELLVARGTGEPGTYGVIVGDAIVDAVTKAVLDSRGYAVQYPASFNISKSSNLGADDVINRLNTQSKQCPDQKFALVGYSQGAGVHHLALGPSPGPKVAGVPYPRPKLDVSVFSKLAAIVMFGDPGFKGLEGPMGLPSPVFPAELQKVVRQNCAPGDPVCDPKGTSFEYHLEYIKSPWQSDSVEFITAAFRGETLPKSVKGATDTEWISFAASSRPKTQVAPKSSAPPAKKPAKL